MHSASPEIFDHHLLQVIDKAPLQALNPDEIWPSVFVFFCLITLAILRNRYYHKLSMVVQSVFTPKILQQLEREDNNPFRLFVLAIDLLFLLNLTFLIYKFNSIFGIVFTGKSSGLQFIIFFILILLFTGTKNIINRVLVFLTGERKAIMGYIASSELINQASGLFLFPWIILAEFSGFKALVFVAGSLVILVLSVILRWSRGLVIGLIEERIGFMQIFSYFCALEILPLLVLVKFLLVSF